MKLQKDKIQHFLVCLIASLFSTLFAIGLAVGKEYGDSKSQGNKWDWYDILADAIGIVCGTGIRALVLWLIFK